VGKDNNKNGILNPEYAADREKKRSLQYRLARRSEEVVRAIEKHSAIPPSSVFDIGTADGRMLKKIREEFPDSVCVGLEYSSGLLRFGTRLFPELLFIQGNATSLPCREKFADVAVATAVLEHVSRPELMVQEVRRILKTGGLAILTTPDPFWERVATKVGHLKGDRHNRLFTLQELTALINDNGLSVLEAYKFMISPVGLPKERAVENFIRSIGMEFLMANQLVVARKT
jgi:ubiquinone/menaquinone biosynthesis C-methylase UbiE